MTFDTLVLAPFSPEGLAELRTLGQVDYEPWTETQTIHDPEELGRRIAEQGYQALVVEADFLFEELFATATTLRIAAICRSALNQVDLDAATEQGVAIVHTPGRNAQGVAELVVALLLGLARRLPKASRYVEDLQWEDPTEPYVKFQGRELAGATLGVLGMGHIGRDVARLALGLGMKVVAYDPYVSRDEAPEGVSLVELEVLLQRGDFVSVHVPDTLETAGLLDARRLALLPNGAYLINVTSPSVVDKEALVDAIAKGPLGGVAMDVHDSHPIAPEDPLLALARDGHNVILTPHIGGATRESVERHSQMVVADIRRFAAGERPTHLANPDVWERLRRA